jgi:hypothetical protein
VTYSTGFTANTSALIRATRWFRISSVLFAILEHDARGFSTRTINLYANGIIVSRAVAAWRAGILTSADID